jgi:5-methylcytosine-specific restriction protein A
MSAYLYTWNPKRWAWVDYADAVYRINNGDQYDIYWSCGNTKKIEVGDIFFLMRLGEDPKGIIGCGYVSSSPYELSHWDAEKAAVGKVALRTDLLFKSLSDQPIISLFDLQKRYPEHKWTPQGGGQTVPEGIADELFFELQNDAMAGFSPVEPKEVKLYAEGKAKAVTIKTYDRSPKARQDCIKHYGYDCAVCGFNFKSMYGDIGKTYIEVHHLKPVSEIGKEYFINPVKDLRPVCANCHRMLHRKRPAISIEELLMHNQALQRTSR